MRLVIATAALGMLVATRSSFQALEQDLIASIAPIASIGISRAPEKARPSVCRVCPSVRLSVYLVCPCVAMSPLTDYGIPSSELPASQAAIHHLSFGVGRPIHIGYCIWPQCVCVCLSVRVGVKR
jgi:hypothetical protein